MALDLFSVSSLVIFNLLIFLFQALFLFYCLFTSLFPSLSVFLSLFQSMSFFLTHCLCLSSSLLFLPICLRVSRSISPSNLGACSSFQSSLYRLVSLTLCTSSVCLLICSLAIFLTSFCFCFSILSPCFFWSLIFFLSIFACLLYIPCLCLSLCFLANYYVPIFVYLGLSLYLS